MFCIMRQHDRAHSIGRVCHTVGFGRVRQVVAGSPEQCSLVYLGECSVILTSVKPRLRDEFICIRHQRTHTWGNLIV